MLNGTGRSKSFTPKAFHIVAQGRRVAAHPGFQDSENRYPERVAQTAQAQKLPGKQDISTYGTLSGFFFSGEPLPRVARLRRLPWATM